MPIENGRFQQTRRSIPSVVQQFVKFCHGRRKKRLEDAYRFPGFKPSRWVRGVFGDPQARIMVLERKQKNGLRRLRSRAQDILRPQDTTSARSLMWGYARLSRGGVPASGVSQLWSCEAGESGLDRGKSAVHQTVCLLCGAALPGVDAERRSQGTALRLADGQDSGDAIHARATPARGKARTVGDWD